MKKSISFLVGGSVALFLIFVASCNSRTQMVEQSPQKIELQSSGDQFLKNFIAVGPDGLSIAVSRNDALFAGATGDGYDELCGQVDRINSSFTKVDREYWAQWAAEQEASVVSKASFPGIYENHNVLESDMFLENFVYAEDGKVVLKISEEDAVRSGATAKGYQIVRSDVATLDQMVQDGQADFDEVKACFDAKRDYITEHDGNDPFATKIV